MSTVDLRTGVVWLIVMWLGRSLVAHENEEYQAYFSQLRSYGLFHVAEEFALARLSEDGISDSQKSIIAVELSRVFASHAVEAKSDNEAAELWDQADRAIAPWLERIDGPRWGAVRVRRATLLSDRAMHAEWRSRLQPDSRPLRQVALRETQAALDDLLAAHAALFADRPSRSRSKGKNEAAGSVSPDKPNTTSAGRGEINSTEMNHLRDEIEFLTIRMNLNLASLSPPGGDQTAAFMEADKQANALAKHLSSDFYWPARFARIEALRRQGDAERALNLVTSYSVEGLSGELMDGIVTEQSRCQLAMGQPAEAIQRVLDYGTKRGTLSSELRSVVVDALLASIEVARRKGDNALGDELWKQLLAQQQLVSGPWRAYVDSQIARSQLTQRYGEQLAGIVREGEQATGSRNWPAALQSYEQAIAVAAQNGQTGLVAEFTRTLSAIQIEAGEWESVVKTLRDFPDRFPADPHRNEAHLLAAWGAGRLQGARPSPENRDLYLGLLRDHLVRFPESPTRGEAEWGLAIDALQHAEWDTALDHLERIPVDHPRFVDAQSQVPYCLEQGFSTHPNGDLQAAWEQRADAAWNRQLATWPHPPLGWNRVQAEDALRWARVLLRFPVKRFAAADQLLTRIQNSRDLESRELARDGTPLDPAWEGVVVAASQLQIITLVGIGKSGEAERMLTASQVSDPHELLGLLSGLSELALSLDEKSQHDLGRIQLVAARRLDARRDGLTPDQSPQVDRCLAQAYEATGDLPEAIAIYETLLKGSPRDRQLMETIGRLSIQRGEPGDLKRAKAVYRQLESFDPPGSVPWLRTRLTVAEICLKSGEKVECRKLLKVTRILYPELGGEKMKSDYTQLDDLAK